MTCIKQQKPDLTCTISFLKWYSDWCSRVKRLSLFCVLILKKKCWKFHEKYKCAFPSFSLNAPEKGKIRNSSLVGLYLANNNDNKLFEHYGISVNKKVIYSDIMYFYVWWKTTFSSITRCIICCKENPIQDQRNWISQLYNQNILFLSDFVNMVPFIETT